MDRTTKDSGHSHKLQRGPGASPVPRAGDNTGRYSAEQLMTPQRTPLHKPALDCQTLCQGQLLVTHTYQTLQGFIYYFLKIFPYCAKYSVFL